MRHPVERQCLVVQHPVSQPGIVRAKFKTGTSEQNATEGWT